MSQRIVVPIKKVHPNAVVPAYAHGPEEDAGVDLVYCGAETVQLAPGARHVFPTGIALELPLGYEGQVRPRSGLARNQGLTLLNSPGTVDPGYRGEIQVIMINLSGEPQDIQPGQRIAQLVISAFTTADFVEVTELGDSKRGTAGFGSSGSH